MTTEKTCPHCVKGVTQELVLVYSIYHDKLMPRYLYCGICKGTGRIGNGK